jgi:hypothetical protein
MWLNMAEELNLQTDAKAYKERKAKRHAGVGLDTM